MEVVDSDAGMPVGMLFWDSWLRDTWDVASGILSLICFKIY